MYKINPIVWIVYVRVYYMQYMYVFTPHDTPRPRTRLAPDSQTAKQMNQND